MKTAKIIRHRHKIVHTINDDVKSVYNDDQYKIVFSDPGDMEAFSKFVEKWGGKYKWDKSTNKVTEDSKTPDKGPFKGDFCMCDVFSVFVTEGGGGNYWALHTVSSPTKFEVWTRE